MQGAKKGNIRNESNRKHHHYKNKDLGVAFTDKLSAKSKLLKMEQQ